MRVRLQSQSVPSASASVRAAATSYPFAVPRTNFTNLPPNLGVTACCREVFWVNNNAQYCVATPHVSDTPTAPLNTSHISSVSAADCAVDEARRKSFTTTFDGLRKIARNEGFTSLWRGLSPTLVMAIPANVIYFTGYDSLRTNRHSPIKKYINDSYAPLMAGSIARVAAASVISPVEMFRTRMQATSGAAGTGVFTKTLLGLQEMAKSQGYSSLWRGLTLTMWRDVPFSGIYWWGYETIHDALTDIRESRQSHTSDLQRSKTRRHSHSRCSRSTKNHTAIFIDSFAAGATSGAFAAIITTPFDVGKTRQQVTRYGNNSVSSASTSSPAIPKPEDRSMPRFLYYIFRTEGIPGLFRGWAARCLKVAPACAIMISSYEIGKKMARGASGAVGGSEQS